MPYLAKPSESFGRFFFVAKKPQGFFAVRFAPTERRLERGSLRLPRGRRASSSFATLGLAGSRLWARSFRFAPSPRRSQSLLVLCYARTCGVSAFIGEPPRYAAGSRLLSAQSDPSPKGRFHYKAPTFFGQEGTGGRTKVAPQFPMQKQSFCIEINPFPKNTFPVYYDAKAP